MTVAEPKTAWQRFRRDIGWPDLLFLPLLGFALWVCWQRYNDLWPEVPPAGVRCVAGHRVRGVRYAVGDPPGLFIAAGMAAGAGMIPAAHAQGTEPATCAHDTAGSFLTNCGITTNFLDATSVAWFYGVGPWFVTLFWGVLVFVIWIRYRNAMLAMMVGATVALGGAVAIPDNAGPMLVALVGSAIGISLYLTISRVRGT